MQTQSMPQFEAHITLAGSLVNIFFEHQIIKYKSAYVAFFTLRGYRYKVAFEQDKTGSWKFIERSRNGKWQDYEAEFVQKLKQGLNLIAPSR